MTLKFKLPPKPKKLAKFDWSVQNINDTYMDVRPFGMDNFQGYAWIGVWGFVILFPLLVYATVFNIKNFFIGSDFFFDLIYFIGTNIMFIGFTLGFAWLNMRQLKSLSFIRFNRHTQKIYTCTFGGTYSVDWADVGFQQKTAVIISGHVAGSRKLIHIKIYPDDESRYNDKHPRKDQWLTAIIEANVLETDGDASEVVKEYIRTFMEEGPDTLNVYAESRIKERNYLSLPLKDAWKRWWPLPVVDPDVPLCAYEIIKGFAFPIRALLLIPNTLADGLWHWMVMKYMDGKYTEPPEGSDEGCKGPSITPADVSRYTRNQAQEMPYREAMHLKMSEEQGIPSEMVLDGMLASEVFPDDENVQALVIACATGDIATIETLIKQGVDINTTGVDGITPLYWAYRHYNQAALEILLKNGATANSLVQGRGFLNHVVERDKNTDALHWLLVYGANPDGVKGDSPPIELCQSWRKDKHLKLLKKMGATQN